MRKIGYVIMIIIAGLLPLAATASASDKVFLERDGSQLLMADKPFRAVGVNKHELLDMYVADLMGGDPESSLAMARESLDALKAIGVGVIRVRGSQFWSAQIEKTYFSGEETRELFWKRYDTMLEDCQSRGIAVVLTIAWHQGAWADLGHESLEEFARNPYSKSRLLFREWVMDLVTRYKDSDTVLFWELNNESNLSADLRPQFPKGVITPTDLSKPHAHIVSDPVVRDRRNNWSSDELAALTRETATLIKSMDKNHLVGTGFSAPRLAAWHLWQGSLHRSDRMDWTEDSEEQQADYLRVITPEPVDLISFHYYLSQDSSFDQLVNIKRTADELGKPVYCGELGVSAQIFPGRVYDHPAARKGLDYVVKAMRILDVPLTLLWTWDERSEPFHEPVIGMDQSEAVEILKEAQIQTAEPTESAAKQDLDNLIINWRKTLAESPLDDAGN